MGAKTCSIDGCEKPAIACGWCWKHYQRWYYHGDPLDHGNRIIGDDEARFWEKVNKNGPIPETRPDLGPCWEWTAYKQNGYGQFKLGSRVVLAHKYAYELLVGPIPEGKQLDHLCRNRACVNPKHLEPVTPKENIHRSPTAPAAINSRKTHCIHGHEFTPENTLIQHGRWRLCRECSRQRALAKYYRQKKKQRGKT
ncbi:MAG: HNH endonuclease signature motif containing protein [Thermacetogeniaceae bacterium]